MAVGTYTIDDDTSGFTYRFVQPSGGVRHPAHVIYQGAPDDTALELVGAGSPLRVRQTSSTASSLTTFSSTSDAQILAANAARRAATIYNRGAGTLYVLLGSGTSSATAFTVRLLPDQYYELPAGYTGEVKGIFGSAGDANVQELT